MTINQTIVTNTGEVFSDKSVTKLGLIGPAGTKFTINDGGEIEIGRYGIWEIDLSNINTFISDLEITHIPSTTPNATIIVDYVAQSKGES